jgi:exopolyphosphatase/guanosine-5'-triphosphate,3'-diphosphate pyrophosphatase
LPAAIARTIQAVNGFQAEAKALGATDIIVLTTSACRDAANRDEFLDGVGKTCGLEVKLISGGREADLIFRGVSSDPGWSGEPILVVDVGGGSAEFIQGCDGKVELSQSLPLGALRLPEHFGERRFPEPCEHLQTVLGPALARYQANGHRLIGTGGTITTFARMLHGPVDHASISHESLGSLLHQVEAMPVAERRKIPGLPPERADIIVAGGAVFLVVMAVLDADELTVSVRNLRYGALVAD